MKFKTFTIYGERCTGTNFLRKLVYDNFYLENTYLPDHMHGWKHWFGHEKNKIAIANSYDCVILSIVRNPIDTLMSFWNNPHNQPKERLVNLETFLTSEFYSTDLPPPYDEILLDRYLDDNWRRYKNIFEMRSVKSKFLVNTIPSLTENSFFIRYEDLKGNSLEILSQIQCKFGLTCKESRFVIEGKRVLPQSRGWNKFDLSDLAPIDNYVIEDQSIKNIIINNLDFEVESLMGYDKESIMKRLS